MSSFLPNCTLVRGRGNEWDTDAGVGVISVILTPKGSVHFETQCLPPPEARFSCKYPGKFLQKSYRPIRGGSQWT